MMLNPRKDERMNFVLYWADFVRNNSDLVWGKQQKRLIDSLMQNAKYFPLNAKEYLDLKKEKHKR